MKHSTAKALKFQVWGWPPLGETGFPNLKTNYQIRAKNDTELVDKS